jgi:hypothetical protein
MAKKIKKSKKTTKPNVFKQSLGSTFKQNTDSKEVASTDNNITTNTQKSSSNFSTESLVPFELKKIGYITASLFIILIILTFLLG